MTPFDGKQSARPDAGQREGESKEETPKSHRLTLELQHSEKFAAMLAHSRASNVIDVSDYLAGMYICNWEHLAEFWPEGDRENVEELLQNICQISPQRWHSWIEMYDRQQRQAEAPRWKFFGKRKPEKASEAPLRPSDALATVLKQAEQIAPAYDRTLERSLPILNTECVLLCIVRNLGSEISRKLALSGLDIGQLEKEVLLPRRRPRV
jgi:hypothetical protein